MTTPGVVRVYEPPGVEPHEDIAVDVLANGSRRQLVRHDGLPLVTQHGALTAIVPGATATAVEIAAPAGLQVSGFSARGTGDATVYLRIDGQVVALAEIDALHKAVSQTLPAPYAAATSANVAVVVYCTALASSDFEAILYGQVAPHG